MLIGLAHLVKLKFVPNIAWLTGLFYAAQSLVSFGDHRGGMFVKASNADQTLTWNMIAIGDDGPRIPAIPVTIMVRKWLRGERVAAGARTAITDITLADFDTEFAKLKITHGLHDDTPQSRNLYEEILGSAYANMSKPLRDLHAIGTGKIFEGPLRVAAKSRAERTHSRISSRRFFDYPKLRPISL